MVCLNTNYVESFVRRTKSACHSRGVANWRNVLNRLESITDALSQSEYYNYDANSNLITEKLPSGALVYFEYDALNRQTKIDYPNDTDSEYSYDATSNLASMTDEHGTTNFAYDAVNRLERETTPYGGLVYYYYDAVGRRSSMDSDGGTPNYVYDAAGRLTTVYETGGTGGGWGTQPWGSSPWGGGGGSGEADYTYYEYNKAANLTKKTLNNGIFAYYAYDAANRVTEIKNCKSDGTPLCYFAYDYDQASRITRVRREDGTNVYYDYDANNRLTGEHWVDSGNTTIYSFEWDYDSVGNRTYQNAGGIETYYSYDAGNQLNNYNEVGTGYSYFDYDDNGNLITLETPDGITYFQYNDAQLVTSIHWPDDTWTYFYYDGLLRRYAISDEGGLRYFTWDQNGVNVLAESDSSGTVTAKYTHGYSPVEGMGGLVQAEIIDSGTSYFQYPILDPRPCDIYEILDENENVVGKEVTNAFGDILDKTSPPEKCRFWWQGYLELKNGFRLSPSRLYYDKVGRFVQRDPLVKVRERGALGIFEESIFIGAQLGSLVSINSGLYTNNNPANSVDYYGLDIKIITEQTSIEELKKFRSKVLSSKPSQAGVYEQAAKHFQFWLKNKDPKAEYKINLAWLKRFPEFTKAIAKIKGYFKTEKDVSTLGDGSEEGKTICEWVLQYVEKNNKGFSFKIPKHKWEALVKGKGALYYASGDSTLVGTSDLSGKITVKGKTFAQIEITGNIVFSWEDRYDWDINKMTKLPPYKGTTYVVSDGAFRKMKRAGLGQDFTLVTDDWKEKLTLTCKYKCPKGTWYLKKS